MKSVELKDFINFYKLSENAQLVHMEEKHNYEDGEFYRAILLDNDKVFVKDIKQTNHPLYNASKDLVTKDQVLIEKANELYKLQIKDVGKFDTYIGCEVILRRSRKAPNKIPLKVTNHFDGYIDPISKNFVKPKIEVTDGNEIWKVEKSCISEVHKGIGFK